MNKKLYVGIVAKKFYLYDEERKINCLVDVVSFSDYGYYQTWQQAYVEIEARITVANDKQFSLLNKHETGYYQFSLLDVYCVSDDR